MYGLHFESCDKGSFLWHGVVDSVFVERVLPTSEQWKPVGVKQAWVYGYPSRVLSDGARERHKQNKILKSEPKIKD
jgi:hypothetical protein